MDEYYFISPEDVLMPRGNRAFGSAGEHGEANAMPWPSVFSGALRSALLGQSSEALNDFALGRRPQGAQGAALGTPDEPGDFRLIWASFARTDGRTVDPLVPLPADLVAFDSDDGKDTLLALDPTAPPAGVCSSGELPMRAILRSRKAGKPAPARLINGEGLRSYLAGTTPKTTLQARELFARELRLGIALDAGARSASEGALYTTEAVRFARRGEPWPDPRQRLESVGSKNGPSTADTGYLVGVRGGLGLLPERGMLRLGGDARPARYQRVTVELPQVPPAHIAADNRFRLVLQTPALFRAGWIPNGVRRAGADYRLEREGFRARLACAALPRFEVVSGWDIARMRPKAAQRAVAAGAVYWFDRVEGDARKLVDWVQGGIWGDNADAARRAEGFNRAWLAVWR
jgi:CRISPR-associated protein Cmr3